MKTAELIMKHLNVEGVGWGGGKTSFGLVNDTGLHINTIRRVLRRLNKERKVYACAPRKQWRTDGKTGLTYVWFIGQPF